MTVRQDIFPHSLGIQFPITLPIYAIFPYGDSIVDGLVQYQKRIYPCARGDSLLDYYYIDYSNTIPS